MKKNEDITKFYPQDAGKFVASQHFLLAKRMWHTIKCTTYTYYECVCVYVSHVDVTYVNAACLCTSDIKQSIDQPNEGPTFA